MFISRGLGKYTTIKNDLFSYLRGKCMYKKWFSEKKAGYQLYNGSQYFKNNLYTHASEKCPATIRTKY